jgi:hypothetical protein
MGMAGFLGIQFVHRRGAEYAENKLELSGFMVEMTMYLSPFISAISVSLRCISFQLGV